LLDGDDVKICYIYPQLLETPEIRGKIMLLTHRRADSLAPYVFNVKKKWLEADKLGAHSIFN